MVNICVNKEDTGSFPICPKVQKLFKSHENTHILENVCT